MYAVIGMALLMSGSMYADLSFTIVNNADRAFSFRTSPGGIVSVPAGTTQTITVPANMSRFTISVGVGVLEAGDVALFNRKYRGRILTIISRPKSKVGYALNITNPTTEQPATEQPSTAQ